MKETKGQVQKQELNVLREKENFSKKASDKNSALSFAAAIAQGTVPHTLGSELFEGISIIGNYSFSRMLERKDNTRRELEWHGKKETFGQNEKDALMEKLAGEFKQEENKIEIMPEANEYHKIPLQIENETSYMSMLTPAAFDQGVFEQTGSNNIE